MTLASRLVAVLAAAFLSAGPAPAGENLVIGGASPGGLWSMLGAGIDRAVRAAGVGSATYQTSAGGFANIALITRGDVDLGIAHDAEIAAAVAGRAPFTEPYENLRAIAVLYDFSMLHPLVTEDFAERHDLATIGDIQSAKAPLRVVVNRPGNIAREVALALLEAHGITPDEIEAWGGTVHSEGSRGAVRLIKGGQADMITNIVFAGHSSIRDMANARSVRMLVPDAAAIAETAARFGIAERIMPADSYPWLDQDVPTVSLKAVLLADATLPDAAVEALTSALIEHLEKMQSVHPAMAALTIEMMGSLATIPYHPGARTAFQRAGVTLAGD
ncbi:MAG: TAXI family TRAP transporter solute-binding subunit [Pseudomonadota bacterium]